MGIYGNPFGFLKKVSEVKFFNNDPDSSDPGFRGTSVENHEPFFLLGLSREEEKFIDILY